MRGRKPKLESAGPAIRARLEAWKQTPEDSRPSLRKLALELGTSHQLLSFYLQRWEVWRGAEEICERAADHGIPRSWSRTAKRKIEAALGRTLEQLEQAAKDGRLTNAEIETLRLSASRGYRRAHQILRVNQKSNLPLLLARAAKSFGSDAGQVATTPK